MPIIYLSLGTNLGQRENNLQEALQALPPTVTVTAISRLYETAAAYVLDQPDFLNLALKGHTELSPPDLLTYLKNIENKMGRQKTIRYGPRNIDLDILFYDELILESQILQIPHPRLAERAFVLRPLQDIAPNLIHPVLRQPIHELVANLPHDDGILEIGEFRKIIMPEKLTFFHYQSII